MHYALVSSGEGRVSWSSGVNIQMKVVGQMNL